MDLTGSGYGSIVGLFEHGDEHSGDVTSWLSTF